MFKRSGKAENKLVNKKDAKLNHEFGVTCIEITPNFKYIFSGSKDRSIKKWCANTYQLIRDYGKTHSSCISAVKVSHNGNWLFSSSQNGEQKQWDVSYDKLMKNYGKVCNGAISSMAFEGNSYILYTVSWDKTIKKFDIQRFCCTDQYDNAHDDWITCVILDRTEKFLFTGGIDIV